jgi:anti-sigma regulatory factor (Ser/Thr protein kinase)
VSGEQARGTEAHQRFAIRLPAEARALAGMRRDLSAWLSAHPLDHLAPEDVILAVHEAAANAAEHAYRSRTAPSDGVVVTCRWEDGSLSCSVVDRGGWRAPSAPGDRGRGLALIRSLADEVEVRSSATGTTVVMSWRGPGAA